MKTFFIRLISISYVMCSPIAASCQTAAAPIDEARVADIISQSQCATGPWKQGDSGHAPNALLKGLATVYLRSYCEVKTGAVAASRDMSRPVASKPHEVFAYFESELNTNSIALDTSTQRLRALFTLGVGVAMNESDGNPTAGPYIKDNAVKAEAGLFQMSYDSLTAAPTPSEWLAKLYASYQADTSKCQSGIFMQGQRDLKLKVIGEGTAAGAFQSFTKECPAFATEYGLVELRVKPTYFGTVIETNPGGHPNKAHFVPACYKMFTDLETLARCGS
jgi:hypothetical protein